MKSKQERAARRKRIKAFFKKIGDFFKHLFNDILPAVTDASLHFMEGFKKAMASGVVDFAADFIPGDADDILIAKIRLVADKVVDELIVAQGCIHKETIEEKLLCFREHFNTWTAEAQGDFYSNLHTRFLANLDDKRLSGTKYRLMADASHEAAKTA